MILRVHFTGSAGCYRYSSQRPVCVTPAGGPRVFSLGSVACVLGLVACEVCSWDRCGAIVAKPLVCAAFGSPQGARCWARSRNLDFGKRSSEVWGMGSSCRPGLWRAKVASLAFSWCLCRGAPKPLDQIYLRLSLCASRPFQSEVGAEK